jgi:hypothetical protein
MPRSGDLLLVLLRDRGRRRQFHLVTCLGRRRSRFLLVRRRDRAFLSLSLDSPMLLGFRRLRPSGGDGRVV